MSDSEDKSTVSLQLTRLIEPSPRENRRLGSSALNDSRSLQPQPVRRASGAQDAGAGRSHRPGMRSLHDGQAPAFIRTSSVA